MQTTSQSRLDNTEYNIGLDNTALVITKYSSSTLKFTYNKHINNSAAKSSKYIPMSSETQTGIYYKFNT